MLFTSDEASSISLFATFPPNWESENSSQLCSRAQAQVRRMPGCFHFSPSLVLVLELQVISFMTEWKVSKLHADNYDNEGMASS